MKKILTLFIVFSGSLLFAQSELKITTKKCIPKSGYYLRLQNVSDDSRCPEGVTCIWAGEVSATVEVYKDKKMLEEKSVTFNSKNKEGNFKWFATYFPKKIKSIGVAPYPKEGQIVKPKKQYIQVVFMD
ncbi:hypothetical protein [Flavobacterium sp.]|uniref:hypothetical protein n=1 Tax=Flavobacterium sp. TaxID=239 RepID=UPI003BC48F08